MWEAIEQAEATFRAIGFERLLILTGLAWGVVQTIVTIMGLRFSLFRRHGLTYFSLQFAIGVAVAIVLVQLSTLIVLALYQIDLVWLCALAIILLVVGTSVFLFQELREREKFQVSKFITLYSLPLIPEAGVYGLRWIKSALVFLM